MPDLLPANIQAIDLLTRINILGGDVALALSDIEMTADEAEKLIQKLTLLKILEIDIVKANNGS